MSILPGLLGATVFIGLLYVLFQLSRMYWDLPFVETRDNTVGDMVSLLDIRKGERAADLGAGDGRLVIALAKAGAVVEGYETNIFLVWRARRKIREAGYADRAHIHWKSLWGTDLSSFTVITVFGIEPIMERLEKKLRQELPPGARVASNYFPFPEWPKTAEQNDALLYCQND